MTSRDTLVLLERTLMGDEVARGDLLERLRPRLVLWSAARMSPGLRAKVEPEDLAQEILLSVHRDLGRLQVPTGEAFLRWLFSVAENRIRDAAEYHGAKKRQPGPPPSFSQTSPSQAFAKQESIEALYRAIAGLREDYREVIRLRRFEELGDPEVGERMGRSENAVRILYCRAVKALRDAMAESE